MAISPPSDIVLDVARAAGTEGVSAAKTRLAALAGDTGLAGRFEVGLDASSGRRDAHVPVVDGPDAMQKFEAMVLQTFLQSMMPQDTQSVYGEGMPGDMWKSMMAEQLANVMAKRGGLGIAERVLKDHYVSGEDKVPLTGVSGDPARYDRAEQQALSTSLIQELQRQLAKDLDRDVSVRSSEAGTI